MMSSVSTLLVVLLAVIGACVAHNVDVSKLYKSYQESKGKYSNSVTAPHVRKAILANNVKGNLSQAELSAMKELFVAPRPDQTTADYHPQLKRLPADGEEIIYYSWHIHTYFFHEDENVTASALALRDAFISTFSLTTCSDECFMGGPWDTCNQGMCVWEPFYGVDGPHPYGQWGVYLPNYLLAETVSWFSLNHGDFNILFHPNTGYMVGDHAPDKRAMWISQQTPLDLEFLVWLQCEWFECSDAITKSKAMF
jgi:aromatic ring-cleaving dioxygenase